MTYVTAAERDNMEGFDNPTFGTTARTIRTDAAWFFGRYKEGWAVSDAEIDMHLLIRMQPYNLIWLLSRIDADHRKAPYTPIVWDGGEAREWWAT